MAVPYEPTDVAVRITSQLSVSTTRQEQMTHGLVWTATQILPSSAGTEPVSQALHGTTQVPVAADAGADVVATKIDVANTAAADTRRIHDLILSPFEVRPL
jgi:hypothetical protein